MKTLRLFIAGILIASSFFSTAQNCIKIECPVDTILMSGPNCNFTYNYNAPQGVDTCAPNSVYTFTNCSQTGRTGPSQSQVTSAYSNTILSGLVTVSGGIQQWVVPVSGNYTVEARGAQGGGSNGGKGAHIQGDFSLVAGDTLKVLVGQQGLANTGEVSISGGGGTYVVKNNNVILVIAGGGGASRNPHANSNGTTLQNGQTGSVSGTTAQGAGGINGAGGGGASCRGGGGAGWTSDGSVGGCGGSAGQGGVKFSSGGFGGNITGNGIVGGFGGGGSSEGINSSWTYAGGGGGYSGGGGASIGDTSSSAGGAASYNNGTNKVDSTGVNLGHGLVRVTLPGNPVSTTLISGLGTGGTFPLGITQESYMATDGVDTVYCNFTVTVIDTPATAIGAFPSSVCLYSGKVSMPVGTPIGGSYSGPGALVNKFDPSVTGTGTFWIKYTDNNGCPFTDSTSVTVVNGPATSMSPVDDTLCDITPAIALNGMPAGGKYHGTGVVGSTFDPSISGLGTFMIIYDSTSGCPTVDTISITVVSCTGIEENESQNSILIFPNPSNGIFKVKLGDSDVSKIEVYSELGELVYSNSTVKPETTIDLSNQANGLYLLKIVSPEGNMERRLLKQ